MGVFDALEQAAGLTAGPSDTASGSPLAAVAQMARDHSGGLSGLVAAFGGADLSALNPDHVQAAIGSGPIAQVAASLGVTPDLAAQHIAQYLPLIASHVVQGGETPADGAAARLEGLIAHFTGGQGQGGG